MADTTEAPAVSAHERELYALRSEVQQLHDALRVADNRQEALHKAIQDMDDVRRQLEDERDQWRHRTKQAQGEAEKMREERWRLAGQVGILQGKISDLEGKLDFKQDQARITRGELTPAPSPWHQALLTAVQAIAQHLTGAPAPASPSPFRFALDTYVQYGGVPFLVEKQRLTTSLYADPTVDYLLRPSEPGRETAWVLEAYIQAQEVAHD